MWDTAFEWKSYFKKRIGENLLFLPPVHPTILPIEDRWTFWFKRSLLRGFAIKCWELASVQDTYSHRGEGRE